MHPTPRHDNRHFAPRDPRAYETVTPRVLVRPLAGGMHTAAAATVTAARDDEFAATDDTENMPPGDRVSSTTAAASSVHERAARTFESLLERKKLATVHPRTHDADARPRASSVASSGGGDGTTRASSASPAVIVRPLHSTIAATTSSESPARVARLLPPASVGRPAPYQLTRVAPRHRLLSATAAVDGRQTAAAVRRVEFK